MPCSIYKYVYIQLKGTHFRILLSKTVSWIIVYHSKCTQIIKIKVFQETRTYILFPNSRTFKIMVGCLRFTSRSTLVVASLCELLQPECPERTSYFLRQKCQISVNKINIDRVCYASFSELNDYYIIYELIRPPCNRDTLNIIRTSH